MTDKPAIVCFDIDETLITKAPHIFPESAKAAIRQLQANGHMAFINTGRTYYSTPALIKEFGFDGYICGCGSYIYLKDKQIFGSAIPHRLCTEIVQLLRDCRIPAFFEGDKAILFDDLSPAQLPVLSSIKTSLNGRTLSSLSEKEQETYTYDKFLVMITEDSLYEKFREISDEFFTYIDRGTENGHRIGEVIQKPYSKATGIQYLMDYFDIPLENCYAAGDSTNDLTMLQFVPHSIAMGNSVPDILPFCEYHTTDILDNGIANALRHYRLI